MKTTFEEMKLTGRLPSPSGVGMLILRLTEREDFSVEELARAIEADPALTGRVLKMANSALHGGRTEVKSVRQAVVRVGAAAVRNVALGFSLVTGHKSGSCRAFDYKLFWSESLARAVCAQVFCHRHDLAPQTEAYTLGLLSGIGRLALASVHPEEYARMLASLGGIAPDGLALAAAEREAFGIDHYEVARCMFDDWNLPESYGEAVACHRDEGIDASSLPRAAGRLVRALRLAVPAADLFVRSPAQALRSLRRLSEQAGACAIGEAELAATFDAAAIEWRSWGEALDIETRELPPFREWARRIEEEAEAAAGQTADKEKAAEPERGGEAEETDRVRVLVVEDDAVTRSVLVRQLRLAGYDVEECDDGEKALRAALASVPDIVLCDWNIPGLDGVELCRQLRRTEDGREVYFLLLTGEASDEDQVVGLEAGADDFVTKPVHEKVLLSRVGAGKRLLRYKQKERRHNEEMARTLARMAVLNRKLKNATVTDVLTDLPNRRAAIDELNEQWDRRDPSRKEALSLIMVDIDHFKKVNDTYGHDVGDAVLREVAAVFRENLRRGDVVCRLGGEEFVVICPGSDAEGAAKVAERLRGAVENHDIVFGDFRGRVTCSFGVAERTPDMETQDDLIKAADHALYEAKRSGRNRVCAARAENARA